jgi:ribonuclease HI
MVEEWSMADADRVYAEYVEPRSFGCKKCGYTSTNRRVVEQHLRQSHAGLFDAVPPAPAAVTAERAPTEAVPTNGRGPTAAATPAAPVEDGTRGAEQVIFYTDAGTWDNGTKRQRSVLAVWDGRTRSIVVDEDLPGTTNNEAEYAAIIAALEIARNDGLRGVLIRSDSQLCVNQINGAWQIKEERLRPLRDRAARLLRELGGRIEWVRRNVNHAGIYLEHRPKR